MKGIQGRYLLASIILGLGVSQPSLSSIEQIAQDAKDKISQVLPEWNISGSNTIRYEYYDNRGAEANSIYPFDGDQIFDEFSVNLNRNLSAFDKMTGQIVGAVSGSDYRSSTEDDLILERLSLSRSKGDARIPYQWTLGDHSAFFSFRTIQRTLKGGLLELQPDWSSEQQKHSLIFLTGSGDQTYTRMDIDDDYYTGASWLVSDKRYGNYSLNAVHNQRDKNKRGTGEIHDRRQMVSSIAGEKQIEWRGEKLNFEGEFAYLDGDIGTDNKDKEDSSMFFQVSGKNGHPYNYRFRFERNGQDFNPQADVVSTNRRSYEFHWGYKITPALNLRGRIQHFQDSFEATTRSDTNVVGVNLAGPFSPFLPMFGENLSGRFDIFLSDKHKASKDTTLNYRLDLNKPLPRGWSGSLGYFAEFVNDDSATNNDARTKELSLQASRGFNIKSWNGTVTPGVIYRVITGNNDYDREITPSLALAIEKAPHSFSANYTMDDFDRRVQATKTDLNQKRFSAIYRFSQNPHTWGIEYEKFNRDPFDTDLTHENTDAWKFALFWTYSFDRPARTAVSAETTTSVQTYADNSVDLMKLAPGTLIEQQIANLHQQFGKPAKFGNVSVMEASIFNDIGQRQRLAYTEFAGTIKNSAHIIELEELGDSETVQQTFEQVRKLLISQYGSGFQVFERGNFKKDFRGGDGLKDGKFVRTMEWQTDKGKIRFGIPRRLDGKVRLEVQHAKRFPGLADSNWSLESVS